MWLDAQSAPTSFVRINGVPYTITSPFIPLRHDASTTTTNHQTFTLYYQFGQASDLTLTYTTYYSRGGGGRGGGGAGWHWQVTGGTLNFNE